MDSEIINNAISMSGFSEEVIDWIWESDNTNKPSMIIKQGT